MCFFLHLFTEKHCNSCVGFVQNIFTMLNPLWCKQTIDLNQASEEDIASLLGVGPIVAERIVKWQTLNGPFKSFDQIEEKISGVGAGKITALQTDFFIYSQISFFQTSVIKEFEMLNWHGCICNHQIDLNQATKEDILSLHGIGDTVADRIVQTRKVIGPYRSFEDVQRLNFGVGQQKIKALRRHFYISNEPILLVFPDMQRPVNNSRIINVYCGNDKLMQPIFKRFIVHRLTVEPWLTIEPMKPGIDQPNLWVLSNLQKILVPYLPVLTNDLFIKNEITKIYSTFDYSPAPFKLFPDPCISPTGRNVVVNYYV